MYQSVRQYCGSRGKKRDALTLIGDTSVLETLGDCIDNTEEKAIYNVSTYEEIYVKLCEKEADILVLDAMIYVAENYDKVSEKSVSRLLSERTGRSFDFARGVVRGFKQRIRKEILERRILHEDKKGRKPSAILLIVTFVLLIVTKIIGNVIIGGLAVVFAMAVAASIVTARIGEFMQKRKEDEDV